MLHKLSVAIALATIAGGAHASALAPFESIATSADAESVVIADLDGDGSNELIVTTGWSWDTIHRAKLHIYRHDPLSDAFVLAGSTSFPDKYPNRVSAVAADLDADGRAEVLVGTGNTLTAIGFDGGVFTSRSINTPIAMEVIQSVDLNGDGRGEIVGQSWSAGAALYRVDDAGNFQLVRQVQTGAAGYNDASGGDLNRDGFDDWVVMSGQSYSAPHAEIFYSNGTGDFVSPSNAFRVAEGENMNGIVVGDVNADGVNDLVLSRSGNSPTSLYVLTQNATGGFDQATVPAFDIPADLAIADMYGDGSNTVLALHSGWSTLSLYATGPSGLSLSEMVSVPYGDYGPSALATGDLTGDGCRDVAIASKSSGVAILRGQQCVAPPDTTPDAFAFSPESAVARGSTVTSDEITISGINGATTISISGGRYSVDGGPYFTDSAGTVVAGQRVRVTHIASPEFSTQVQSVLTVGGVSAAFVSTTEAMDTVPDPLTLIDQSGVATGATVVSAPIAVSGINAPATITVSGGSYRINGGSFTTAAGSVQPGDQVQVQHMSATSALTAVNTSLTIGGVTDVFTSTTGSADTTPNAFAFTDVSGARRGRLAYSNTISVSGITAATPVSISGGNASYSKNGGAYTSNPGTVQNGDTLRLRLTASSTAYASVSTTLTVGGVSDNWSVTSGKK